MKKLTRYAHLYYQCMVPYCYLFYNGIKNLDKTIDNICKYKLFSTCIALSVILNVVPTFSP